MRRLLLAVLAALVLAISTAQAEPLKILAAENFYGDIARQIGGRRCHRYQRVEQSRPGPARIRGKSIDGTGFAKARIVIYSGADYDPWALKLLSASPSRSRIVIDVAQSRGAKKAGDNPHIWYQPDNVLLLARDLADQLSKLDPAHAADYRQRFKTFERSMQPLAARISELRRKYADTPGDRDRAGIRVHGSGVGARYAESRFQLAVMNDTEPSAADIAAFRAGSALSHRESSDLQPPDQRRFDPAYARDRTAIRDPGRRRHRDRTWGRITRSGCARNSMRSIARSPANGTGDRARAAWLSRAPGA